MGNEACQTRKGQSGIVSSGFESLQRLAASSITTLGTYIPVHEGSSVKMEMDVEGSAEEETLSKVAIVCGLNGLWPSLVNLHLWISEKWRPLVIDEFFISLLARVFFTVCFE